MINGVRIGDKLRSNDKRTFGREVEVIDATNFCGKDYAVYKTGFRKAKIRFDLIFHENEAHHGRGWTLVGAYLPVASCAVGDR